jgi:hypothetical protein
MTLTLINKICSWSIERQAAEFYTREVFERFQEMLQASARFYPLRAEQDGLNFDLVPNPGQDMKTHRVQVIATSYIYTPVDASSLKCAASYIPMSYG